MNTQDFSFIPATWTNTKGAGIKIALFDTGIELGHPCLKHLDKAGNKFDVAAKGFNPLTASGNDNISDGMFNGNFHGTQMAGVISCKPKNGNDPVGVAPEAEIIICKMRDSDSESYADYFIKGLQLAINKHVDIISCAYTPTFRDPVDLPLINSLFKQLAEKKILLITTNANTARLDKLNLLQFPSDRPEAIVTATLQDAMLKKWTPGNKLNPAYQLVLAEKEGMYCSDPLAEPPFVTGSWKNSHATAALAGICALYLSFLKAKNGINYKPIGKEEMLSAIKAHTKVFKPEVLLNDKTQIFYNQ